eukprot:CAMPEP_0116544242 /NCGR_PEP_ID=MMETSP0397-20121206/2007_1 /TAXON_ID=216820 /ORGANISM="Cyclophora tenuis, Strain ECT3854" /LENGTH=101 /DNA_ID=CAMNT_0004068429 /DNA_START=26 /DNA_END=331 /DNA_ORIENTATION=-
MSEEAAKFTESLKQQVEESRKKWASRGKEARLAAQQARLAKSSWRNLSGMNLMVHEIRHVGNRPFAWGFLTVFLGSLYLQSTFTDEDRAASEYYQTYHAKK